ncbi:MAG: hypothetical protein H7A23_22560 [Leptospiraceae bacterium]|nr:hypothetical protein [Leptospiraceae bacterium]
MQKNIVLKNIKSYLGITVEVRILKWKEFEIVKTIFEGDSTVIHRAIDTNGKYIIIKHLKNEFPTSKEILKLKKEWRCCKKVKFQDLYSALLSINPLYKILNIDSYK